jgi:hypothetical protein
MRWNQIDHHPVGGGCSEHEKRREKSMGIQSRRKSPRGEGKIVRFPGANFGEPPVGRRPTTAEIALDRAFRVRLMKLAAATRFAQQAVPRLVDLGTDSRPQR